MTKRYPSRNTPVYIKTTPVHDHLRRSFQDLAPIPAYVPALVVLALFVLATCLAGVLTPAVARPAGQIVPEFTFERQEINIGSAPRQTVMTGFLSGGNVADVAVVNIDDHGNRRVRIYTYENETGSPDSHSWSFENGSWSLKYDGSLRPGVSFVDMVRIGDRDRLITYEQGRLSALDPDSSTERELAAVISSFKPPRTDEIPHVDITRDVNGDGRDDLVVPGADGFLVFIQSEDGSFADPVEVGPPAVLDRIYGADGYRYDPWSQARIHEFDYNGDDRVDLVTWNQDRFEAHLQDERGMFTAEPVTFETGAAFDSDDLSYLSTGDMTGRVLHLFSDLNGDGVADLVVFSLDGDSISDKRSAYEVHFGTRTFDDDTSDDRTPDGGTSDDRTHFSADIDVLIQSEGHIQLDMKRGDFDGDGESDLVVTTIETKHLESSLFKRIKGFMGDDTWLNLEFYRVNEGRIPNQPTTTRRIQLDGAPSHREPGWVPLDVVLQGGKHVLRKDREQYRRAFNKNLFIGDVTGNGRSDLLIEWTHRELHVFPGVAGPELFADLSQKVSIELPNDEEHTWLTDINRDGRQDIVMHHPLTRRDAHGAPEMPPGTEPQRVTMLIAQ